DRLDALGIHDAPSAAAAPSTTPVESLGSPGGPVGRDVTMRSCRAARDGFRGVRYPSPAIVIGAPRSRAVRRSGREFEKPMTDDSADSTFRAPARADPGPPRESMSFDVVIVGAGPAGLAAACRLGQLAAE